METAELRLNLSAQIRVGELEQEEAELAELEAPRGRE